MEVKREGAGGGTGSICSACLSAGRALQPLAAPHLLWVLLEGLLRLEPSASLHTDTKEVKSAARVYVCWECRAALHKTMQFKLRAGRAHQWLEWARTQSDDQKSVSLSTLQYCYKTNLDIIFLQEESVKVETVEHVDEDVTCDAIENYEAAIREPKPESEERELQVEKEMSKRTKGKRKVKSAKIKRKYVENSSYEIIEIGEIELIKLREQSRTVPKYMKAQYKCETCIRKFACVTVLEQHNKRYHAFKGNGASHICHICGGTFAQEGFLRQHMPTHYKRYQCNYCDYTTLVRRTMYQHYLDKHKGNNGRFKCADCDQKFQKSRQLSAHIVEAHRHYECDKCGKKFPRQSAIVKHLRMHDLTCPHCGLTFGTRKNLVRHQSSQHRTHDAESGGTYCVECDKKFRHRIAYLGHVKGVHGNKKLRRQCPRCDKSFSKPSYLTNHINHVHFKSKRFQCHLCNKSFLNGHVMRRHIDVVHEGKALPKNKFCDICGRGFQTKRILENHRRTHTGERPYKCEQCNAAFTQHTALRTHVKHIHLHEPRIKNA